jgi:MOSC domain-containing protein YiiM
VRLISVNAGQPREARWRGRIVRSAIWKDPLPGRVRVTKLHLEGDRQADPSLHGGADMAIYVYPAEHYAYWRRTLGELAWGSFGENLTTEGLLEDEVRIGDELRIGSAVLEVTQPRTPCAKLAMRLQRPSIVREFTASRRCGFYCSVRLEGALAAGDEIAWGARATAMPTVAELFVRS